MNLTFENIGTCEQDGHPFIIQRCYIGNNRHFWFKWRQAQNKAHLEKRFIIRRESNGWNAYRLIPMNHENPARPFKRTYRIKSTSHLYPYQAEAVEYLCESMLCNGAAADGSDTGLGKTYMAMKVAQELGFKPGIICRKGGIYTWKRACVYFGIKPLFIVNWEQAKGENFPFTQRQRGEYSGRYEYSWKMPPASMIIFDECHMANHEGSQNNALYKGSKGYASLSLSATFADRPSRLRALFHILGIMPDEQFTQWLKDRACLDIDDELESVAGVQDMTEISKMIYPRYGYRLSYEHPEVKKFFPEAVHQVEIVTLSRERQSRQNDLYRRLCEKVAAYQFQGQQAEALVADLRYRQAAELLKAEELIELARQYRYEGKSVIIFVNFKETMLHLATNLDTRSLIYGGQGTKREEIIDDFQNNRTDILICMSDAGGQSISLHDVHGNHPRISLICPTYNPITLKQVLGRTRRAGTKSIPIMKLVYAGGTIEEKVAERVMEKITNISALNGDDLNEPDLFMLRSKS